MRGSRGSYSVVTSWNNSRSYSVSFVLLKLQKFYLLNLDRIVLDILSVIMVFIDGK